jgi:hypothetical protein
MPCMASSLRGRRSAWYPAAVGVAVLVSACGVPDIRNVETTTGGDGQSVGGGTFGKGGTSDAVGGGALSGGVGGLETAGAAGKGGNGGGEPARGGTGGVWATGGSATGGAGLTGGTNGVGGADSGGILNTAGVATGGGGSAGALVGGAGASGGTSSGGTSTGGVAETGGIAVSGAGPGGSGTGGLTTADGGASGASAGGASTGGDSAGGTGGESTGGVGTGGGNTGGTGCGPSYFFCDDFQDGNATGWSVYGGSWTVLLDGATNQVYQGGGGSPRATSTVNATASLDDQTVQADIKIVTFGGTGTNYRAGVVARFNTSGPNYITLSIDQVGNLRLLRSTNPMNGCTDQFPSGVDPFVWNTYSISAQGSPGNLRLRIYLNGTLIHDCTTDVSGAPETGTSGVMTYGSGVVALFDNVAVTSP